MDVASAGELKLALDAGADPLSIGFAGPGKRAAELRQAVASGVLLHVSRRASCNCWPMPRRTGPARTRRCASTPTLSCAAPACTWAAALPFG
jgi:hypothetical protein